MSISIPQVPVDLRVPGVYAQLDTTNADPNLLQTSLTMLLFGQKLSTGTAAANTPVLVSREEDAIALFGRGSLLHHQFKAVKQNNRTNPLYCFPLDDNVAGVAATGSIAVSGTATAAGTINLYVGGRNVQVPVAVGDVANTVAAAINTAIGAINDLPLTATVSTNTVTLTARHKGEVGNEIDLRLNYYGLPSEVTPAGLTLTITAMANGATNPVLSTALASLPSTTRYDTLICPYTDTANLNALYAELTTRWNATVMLDGTGFTARRNTFANLVTFGDGRNDEFISCIGFNNSPSPAYLWSAAYAATVTASVNNDPAAPVWGLPLVGILPPPEASRFDPMQEQDILLRNGISTFEVDQGGIVRISRGITFNQETPQGADTIAWLDINRPFTYGAIRKAFVDFAKRRFRGFKIANDGTRISAGQKTHTPSTIEGEYRSLADSLEEAGLVENAEVLKTSIKAIRNPSNPTRVDLLALPNPQDPLLIVAISLGFQQAA